MKTIILLTSLVVCLAPLAQAKTLVCSGESIDVNAGIQNNDKCSSGYSLTSPDMEDVCVILSANVHVAPGDYFVTGRKCDDGSVLLTSARVAYLPR